MLIRKATESDWDGIWQIFHPVVSQGETYAFAPDISQEAALALWMRSPAIAYVALESDTVVGTYMLKPNQPGLGAHVANAGFMVSPQWTGRGIGRALGEHALQEARESGYLAMQFNVVVSTNKPAIALWKSLGFSMVGTIPQGFRHRSLGLVDIHIMHRFV